MEYTVSQTKRNIIILSSIILILYFLGVGLFFFLKGPIKLDTLLNIIQNVIYIIPYSYLMLVFIDYFRFYKLKVLQTAFLAVFIMEIISRGFQFTNLFDMSDTRVMHLATNMIWIVATAISLIFLFQTKIKDYPGIISIRKYVIGIVPFFVLGTSITFMIKPDSIFGTLQLVNITLAIPYIFTIDFAVKLCLKN